MFYILIWLILTWQLNAASEVMPRSEKWSLPKGPQLVRILYEISHFKQDFKISGNNNF